MKLYVYKNQYGGWYLTATNKMETMEDGKPLKAYMSVSFKHCPEPTESGAQIVTKNEFHSVYRDKKTNEIKWRLIVLDYDIIGTFNSNKEDDKQDLEFY